MKLVENLHNSLVYSRRMEVLSEEIVKLLPQNARILDIGCGDGMIDKLIMTKRPDVTIEGIDVLVRDKTYVPVIEFNGSKIPHDDNSFDVALFIDVLHHTNNQEELLSEAKRITKSNIIIKDHVKRGCLSYWTLRFMDWFGNAHYGVVLPYNYWKKAQWEKAFENLGLKIATWTSSFKLYSAPANWFFGGKLHFITSLSVNK